jgi:hypothetical protein
MTGFGLGRRLALVGEKDAIKQKPPNKPAMKSTELSIYL